VADRVDLGDDCQVGLSAAALIEAADEIDSLT
jgi:hypothetical protein